MRPSDRRPDELRSISFVRDFTKMAPGAVLSCYGDTQVLCTVSYDPEVPPWIRGKGVGWVTSEYSMLPGSTTERARREIASGRLKGRTQEIQRLIGRSLRAVCNLSQIGFIEIQGTAERQTFDARQLAQMISLATKGITEILDRQREFLAQPLDDRA